jgi:hypothetical protein
MFDEFWNKYPRKIAKGAARRMYERALKVATHDEIVAGLEELIANLPADPQFIPHASTWLNGERWADEYEQHVRTDWWDARKEEDEIKQRIHSKLRVVE